ncbi:MAG: SDR family oxidoreductase [Comamonadaceae bacterium]|nr:MAG: SDR family oxidoreductase [Comamonadaceae bacterium]
MFKDGCLAGRRILVTGGGTGLGLAMAGRFAELGATLVLCGRRREVLAAAADRLHAEFAAEVQTEACDLRESDQVEAMFERIWARAPLDVLVNNAAATFIAQTDRLSPRAVDAILGPTLHGAAYCTIAAGRRWIDAGRNGTVLSILSTSVRTGRAFTVPSAMAKSALQAMTRSLAVEWGPHGIRLVAIAPGAFPTPGAWQQLMPEGRAGSATPGGRVPAGRTGQASELADLASYLVSDAAAYITGETIAIDGGAHLRTSGAEDLLAWTADDWTAHRAKR